MATAHKSKVATAKSAPKPADDAPEEFGEEELLEFLTDIDEGFANVTGLDWFRFKAPSPSYLAKGLNLGDFEWRIEFEDSEWVKGNEMRLPSSRTFQKADATNINAASGKKANTPTLTKLRATHLHTGISVHLATPRIAVQASKQARTFLAKLVTKYVARMGAAL